jgi:simple sugar transport system permease protein
VIKKSPVIYEKTFNWTKSIPEDAIIPRIGLDKLFNGKQVNIGILFAILIAIIILFVLKKTTFGYEMKASGLNPDAAKYGGINVKKCKLVSMLISGALSGLSGGLYYLTSTGTRINVIDTIASEGFTGIAVAMLGMLHPIGTIFSGFFIAYLKVGGLNLQSFSLDPSIVDVITAVIIFVCAFAFKFKSAYIRLLAKMGGNENE